MSTLVMGRSRGCLGEMTPPHPKDSQGQCPLSLGAPGRPALGKASAKSRLRPPAAEDEVMAAVRWPEASQQAGAPRGSPHMAWSDNTKEPGPWVKARSLSVWSADEDAEEGDSSVSSGRLSGSSGGHGSCTPPHGTWKERTPQVPGPPRQPRESNPRLEQLRNKIRAQAQWQASCASLGTSAPSSASHLYRAATPAPQRKARKPTNPPLAPAYPGSGVLSGAKSGVEDKATPGQGREASRVSQHQASVPREKTKRMKSSSCKREKAPKPPTARRAAKDTGRDADSELVGVSAWRKGQALVRVCLGPLLRPQAPQQGTLKRPGPPAELGHSAKVGVGESSPVRPRPPSPVSVRGDPQVSANTPHLASGNQPMNIQAAMAILRDLRQQIQAGLELARDRHPRRGLELRDLVGRRRQGPWKPPDVHGSFWKSSQATTEGMPTSERAGSLPTAQRWSTLARWESYPQRTWAAHGRDPSFQRPGSCTEKLNSFPQRPWSASARQTFYPQKTREVQGQDPSFQRPGSPSERWGPSLQRPWSASAGQAWGPQRAWTACEDREAPAWRPWSPLERPRPPTWRPWSASFTQGAGPLCHDRGPLLTPSGAKLAWLRPSRGALQNTSGKEDEVRPPPPCPKPRGALGPLHGSESLREFMRQKTAGWRRQALEEKASATRALGLRNQRLQGVHRKQKEAGLCRAGPVVSQTTPGIVTFVPHSAQSRGLEAPALQWSKVTSGMVLGDQEAPGSFCLCLNRALNPAETLEAGGPQDGWEGAALPMSASSSLGPLQLQDLTTHYPSPGLCIYLDPEESERLGMPGPLHFRYKQARLQALEAMATILKQRIDTLTDKLRRSEAADAPGPPPFSSSAPACPGALLPNLGRGEPWHWAGVGARPLLSTTCFRDAETLPWSPGWERPRSVSPMGHHASKPRGTAGPAAASDHLPRRGAKKQDQGPSCHGGGGAEVNARLSKGFMEDGRLELDKRLARNVASFQALSPFAGSPCQEWGDLPALVQPPGPLQSLAALVHAGSESWADALSCPKNCVFSPTAHPPPRPVCPGLLQTLRRGGAWEKSPEVNFGAPGSAVDSLPRCVLLLGGQQGPDHAFLEQPCPHCLWEPSPDHHRAVGCSLFLRQALHAPSPAGPSAVGRGPGGGVTCSLGAAATPDPRCGSLRLEEMPSARGVGSVAPWTLRSCGPLSDIQQKSRSFLESLKLDQRKQERALALLQQQAELEVWETQKALGELLFRHRLQRLMEKHSTRARPGTALELERPQVCVDRERKTSGSTVTASPSSRPLPGGAAAARSPRPEGGKKGPAEDETAQAEPVQEGKPDQTPSQLPRDRLYPRDKPILQHSRTRPRSAAPGSFSRFALRRLEQSLREEELRAQHQAALLRLREKALREKTRAELGWLEHQRRYLSSTGSFLALVALTEKQHQALSNLERELREIRCLRNSHLCSHRERKLLLQLQKDILSVQRSAARLRQERQAPRLPQSSSPNVKATREEGPGTGRQPEGPASRPPRSPTSHSPGSPVGHRPRRSPEDPQVPHALTGQQDRTPPRAASAADSHLQPPRLAWGEDTPAASGRPGAGDQLEESHGHAGRGNQAGQQQWRRGWTSPLRRDPAARGSIWPGSDRAASRWACVTAATPASLSRWLSAQGPAGGHPSTPRPTFPDSGGASGWGGHWDRAPPLLAGVTARSSRSGCGVFRPVPRPTEQPRATQNMLSDPRPAPRDGASARGDGGVGQARPALDFRAACPRPGAELALGSLGPPGRGRVQTRSPTCPWAVPASLARGRLAFSLSPGEESVPHHSPRTEAPAGHRHPKGAPTAAAVAAPPGRAPRPARRLPAPLYGEEPSTRCALKCQARGSLKGQKRTAFPPPRPLPSPVPGSPALAEPRGPSGVSLPGLQRATSLDVGQPPGPAFPVRKHEKVLHLFAHLGDPPLFHHPAPDHGGGPGISVPLGPVLVGVLSALPPGGSLGRLSLSTPSQTQAGDVEGSLSAGQLRFQPTKELPPGDPQTKPSPRPAEERTQGEARTGSRAPSFWGWSRHPPRAGDPPGPREASCSQQALEGSWSRAGSGAGLDVADRPVEEPVAVESASGVQRIETCWQEDPRAPFSCQEAAQLTAFPAAATAEVAAPPARHEGRPPAQRTASWDLGSACASAPGTCSGSSAWSLASSSGSSPSCPSLQEFQKASAILVQLSESSVSLSDGDTLDADLSWSGGLHQGGGPEAWEGLEGSGALSLRGSCTGAGGPEPTGGLPDTPSPRSGLELSEAPGEVWDQESLREPGAGAVPTPGHRSPAGDVSHPEHTGGPPALPPLLGPGEGQDDSGSNGSLTCGSNTGKAKGRSPEAASTTFPSQTSSRGDLPLSLSFPSRTSASEGAEVSKRGEMGGPAQASAGCPGGPCSPCPSLSTNGEPLQASPEPEVPGSPQAPPRDLGGPAAPTSESRAPGCGGSRAPAVLEEACPPLAGGVLPEILAPVDKVLSCGGADLPSSTRWDTCLPPPPPTPPAEGEAVPAGPHSEDFPSPPEEVECPGGSLGAPGEDSAITLGELPSWSGEGLPEPLSLGSRELGLCPGVAGQGRSLAGELGGTSSVERDQATGGQWSEPQPRGWPGSSLCGGAGDVPVGGLPRLSAQPPSLSRVACVAGDSPAAGDPGLPGSGRGDPAMGLGADPRTDLPGMDRAEVVDLVSTQLTRRILCDTLAALSEAAPPGSLATEGPAGASRVIRAYTAATGQSWGGQDF
ncbi:coiled-coil domain-containing protein 187 [Hippopotamus amphibius kiboko]|uniref:coiled-coil domain-containing protein 187 n=1 Tax=Hippopotamus amphibius kiboko TaxID=575201 RepID=UPI002597CD52|nr:coiled-coil domain-containing protein 187 [Hippopotamus amphibius kiboko]